jgi:MFS family permease
MPESEPHPQASTIAWRSRDFRLYSAARFLGTAGVEAQAVGVAWQVYEITHSALALGGTGLALFLPGLLFTLPAGHIADRHDRRNVILACYALQFVATTVLLAMAVRHVTHVWAIYAILGVIGTGRCFVGPAGQALVPTLVPREHFVNAVTWGASVFQIAGSVGPMIGGFLFTIGLAHTRFAAFNGAPLVYLFTLAAFAVFIALVAQIAPRPIADKKGISLDNMLAGLRYVMRTRLLLGSISLDLFAVLLGGAVSLLPIFASDILHRGPHALGLLRAAPSVGALVMSLLLVFTPIKRRAGKTMLACVGIFGAATVLFGISRSLWLSIFALFVTGAADMISVVTRTSILQLATPDAMRGRVSSINWLFLGASNELGEYESGLTAHWLGAVRAVIIGGIASMTVTGLWSVFFPALRDADKLTAESLVEVEEQYASQEPTR